MPGSPVTSGRSMHSFPRVGAGCGPGEESVDVPGAHPDSAAARPTAASKTMPLRQITTFRRLRSVIGSIETHACAAHAGAPLTHPRLTRGAAQVWNTFRPRSGRARLEDLTGEAVDELGAGRRRTQGAQRDGAT